MVTGLVVPHNVHQEIRKAEFKDLTDYQAAVDGFIETVHIQDHPLTIVADEDGKVKQLPINRRATILWWLLNPDRVGGDLLVGDVVVVGAEHRGEMTDVAQNLIGLLLDTKQYQVKVLLSPATDTWVPIGLPVNNFFEAAIRALRLIEVWEPPTNVRVVPA